MLSVYSRSLHPLRTSRTESRRLENHRSGDVQLLRVDDDDLMTAIQTFVQMLDKKRGEAVEHS